jgi:hypothetical protein
MTHNHNRSSTFIDLPELKFDVDDEEQAYDDVAEKVLRSLMLQLNTYEQVGFLQGIQRVVPGILNQLHVSIEDLPISN